MTDKPETMIAALRILARDIHSEDGVANLCISNAADMIEELTEKLEVANKKIKCIEHTLEAALAICKVNGEESEG